MFFFFNDTATTEIYTLSLHDALPICLAARPCLKRRGGGSRAAPSVMGAYPEYDSLEYRSRTSVCVYATSANEGRLKDRKSTRLNSSHANISYAVFCLKKNKRYIPSGP